MRDSQLLRSIPRIRRARGFRLYDVQGKRYLDLYRDGALLGHRAGTVITAMKSALAQGLVPGLPSIAEGRLAAALARLLPACPRVRFYATPDRALAAASVYLGVRLGWSDVDDPALEDGAGSSGAALWRPFLPPAADARVLLPVLPFTVAAAPAPVCFAAAPTPQVPVSDVLPGFILAGALRGLAALEPPAATRGGTLPGIPPGVPALEQAVDAAAGWARRGPYVRARCAAEEYGRVHAAFLREGVLLFPGYPGPSVLPGECSPGESRHLADLFSRVPGG